MSRLRSYTLLFSTALALGAGDLAQAQTERPAIDLVLETSTALRVVLPNRVRMKEVGQPITGSLVEDVYAYDRVVLPAGTRVIGRVMGLEGVSDRERAGSMLNGDFTPLQRAVLRFESLVLADGREIAVSAEVRSATEHLPLTTREPRGSSEASREEVRELARRSRIVVHAIGLLDENDPGKAGRGREELDALCAETGGLAYYPRATDDTAAIALDLAHQIRSRYTIAYSPANQSLDGSYRRIRVVARGPGHLSGRTRAGYRAVAGRPVMPGSDAVKQ
jgi:hypothetical protein